MGFYEKLKRLGEIINDLVGLYGELSEELPQLQFADAHTRAKSELKKMAMIK